MSETREITRQLADQVASALGGAWNVDLDPQFDDYAGRYLNGPDKARLFLRLDFRNEDRVTIRGVYPDFRTTPREIGVSRDRGPAVIAREITRRLLPEYTEQLRARRQQLAESDAMAAKRGVLADELTAILPGSAAASDDRREVAFHTSGPWGKVRIGDRADSGTIEAHALTPESLRKIAAIIAKQRAGER